MLSFVVRVVFHNRVSNLIYIKLHSACEFVLYFVE